jgi:hypothetical protein
METDPALPQYLRRARNIRHFFAGRQLMLSNLNDSRIIGNGAFVAYSARFEE